MTKDGQLYIVIKHTTGSLTIGSTINVVFTITGPDSVYYQTIPSITLTLISPTSFQAFPSATSLSPPILNANTATITMRCDQASTIYWGLGIFPSILNHNQADFKRLLTTENTGYVTNYTEANDFFTKSYGFMQGQAGDNVQRKIYNVQSGSNYLFKYYCMNPLGHLSDAQSVTFTSLNYGAYLMKV